MTLVRDVMTPLAVEVGTGHTLMQTARMMAAHRVGAAVVNDPDGAGPGIITERDLLQAFACEGATRDSPVGAHLTSSVVYAAPDWSLDQAATAMIEGGFRHLVVMRGGEVAGVISVRDIVRAWANERGLLSGRTPGAGSSDTDTVVGTA